MNGGRITSFGILFMRSRTAFIKKIEPIQNEKLIQKINEVALQENTKKLFMKDPFTAIFLYTQVIEPIQK